MAAGRPDRAAAYYNAARRACADCTLVAADVIDGPGMLAWLARSGDALLDSRFDDFLLNCERRLYYGCLLYTSDAADE